ncbi:MAG: HEAT repeat domain-containing protein [Deltaproteobacteria bacterium]|nr:HEAT repeat domain-containing protein [Deltaproteobacteria bacterium]
MDLTTIDRKITSEDPSLRRQAATMLADIGGIEALDRLEVLLKDPNNGVRDAAQNSIILLGGKDAIEKMVLLLTHEDPAIRNMAIDILRKIGEDGLDILHCLAKDSNDNIRLFVLDILGSIGSSDSLDILIEGLYDTNPNVRNAAVISLGELGDPKSFDHLKQLINDEEWIRFSVIETLAKIPIEGIVDFLMEELKRWSGDEITMCAILETLGEIGSERTVRPLMDMLQNANEYVEVSIIQTLLKIIPVDSITILEKTDKHLMKSVLELHLAEADDNFAHSILEVLSCIGDKKSADYIINLARKVDPDTQVEKWEDIREALIRLSDPSLMVELLDQDERCQILASQILAKIGTEKEGSEIAKRIFTTGGYVKRAMTDAIAAIAAPSSREPLLKLIHDKDGHVVSSSLRALGEIGNPEDIAEIEQFLRHPYPDVRSIALEAIAQIGGEFAEDTLAGLLKDDDPQVRTMALSGLDKMESTQLESAVQYMLRDRDGRVRMAAVEIIKDDMMPVEKDLLMGLFHDELDEIRHLAIDIIGQRRIDDLRSFLEDATASTQIWTAYHAIEALGKFKDEDAKDRLLHILKTGPDVLRIPAVKALGQWGDDSLASELEVYMDDENLDVARAVAEAVDRLQGVVF